MAQQDYTDNNRHDNIGHQHIVYDKQVRTSQSDGLGYIPTPRVPGETECCTKGEQGFSINNKRKWPIVRSVAEAHIFQSTWMSGTTVSIMATRMEDLDSVVVCALLV